jgi:hypothetical protein
MATPTDDADCGHCPPDASHGEAPCETGSALGCEVFPGYQADGRQVKLKLNDVAAQMPLGIIETTLAFPSPVIAIQLLDKGRLKFAGDPPLNIRHCVFLK